MSTRATGDLAPGPAPLLEATDVSVVYGGVRAVDAVSLSVPTGELVGLIGPNGAGKTTFVDAMTGFAPVDSGELRFVGRTITGWSPHRRARLGLGRTFQSVELFEDLSVRENLLVGVEAMRMSRRSGDRPRSRRVAEGVDWALELLALETDAGRLPSELSQGHRKLVGVARALATEPRLVCLDEPAAGLDTTESAVLGEHLRAIVDHGITVLLVDHDMGLVLGACDHVWVLDFGRVIASGTPDEIRVDPGVVSAYLGARAASAGRDASCEADARSEPEGSL